MSSRSESTATPSSTPPTPDPAGTPTPQHYVRGPQVLPLIGPIPEGHEMCGRPCFACLAEFKAGEYFTQILLGPGIDPEKRRLARERVAYEGVAIGVHFSCATGIESDEEVATRARRALMDLPVEPKRLPRQPRLTKIHRPGGDDPIGTLEIAKR